MKKKIRGIIKVAQQIKSNVDNRGKIWEIKQKVQRKNETHHTIKDEKTTKSNVHPRFRGYKKYYENLLKIY